MNETATTQEGGSAKGEPVAWIGLDWADQQHQIAEYSVETGKTSLYVVKHSGQDFEAWLGELRARYNSAKVAIVLEQARGSVVYALMGCTFVELYPVNPQSVASYRKAFVSSGAKSDRVDAELMAEMVRKHPERFRVLRADDPETRSIRMLVEGRRKQVDQVTRLTNQLTAQLKNYFPQALEFAGELDSVQACAFLKQWPTLGELKQATGAQLRKFYKRYGRPREAALEERIKRIKEAVAITEDPAVLLAGTMMVRSLAAQILALLEAVEQFDQAIAELFQKHPDCSIFESFPGAGPALAPRLLAAFGVDRDRWESAADLQKLSGIAPVTHQSGKGRFVTWRLACPKFLRQTFQEYAEHSMIWCDWANAFYQGQRDVGKQHHAAVRALAYKWIRIIYRCWKTRRRYDDQTYLTALQSRSSPLLHRALRVQETRKERKASRKQGQVSLPPRPAEA
jgi:transposase